MDFVQVTVLAVVQGLTEFLPISSSAHLILVPVLTGWPDQGLAFDVSVHVGTLAAVVWYFRDELWAMAEAWIRSLRGVPSPDARLAWGVLLGTIPVGLAGLLFGDFIEARLRSPLVIAAATLVFGLALGWADWAGRRERDEHQLRWTDVLWIGLAQSVALIPGTSRSGITIVAPRARPRGTIVILWGESVSSSTAATIAWPASWVAVILRSSSSTDRDFF